MTLLSTTSSTSPSTVSGTGFIQLLQGDAVVRATGILGLGSVAAIHLYQIVPTTEQTPALGAAFVLLILACCGLAMGLLHCPTEWFRRWSAWSISPPSAATCSPVSFRRRSLTTRMWAFGLRVSAWWRCSSKACWCCSACIPYGSPEPGALPRGSGSCARKSVALDPQILAYSRALVKALGFRRNFNG